MTIASGERLESGPEPEPPTRRLSRPHLVVGGLVALAVVAVLLPIGVHGVPPTTSEEPLGTLEWTLVAENVGICVHVTSEGPLEHTDRSTAIGRGLTHYKVEDINSHWTMRWATTSWQNGACTTTPAHVEGLGLTGVWSSLGGDVLAVVGAQDPELAIDDEPESLLFDAPSAQGSTSSGLGLPEISGWVRRPDTCYLVSTHAEVQHPGGTIESVGSEAEKVCLDTAW